MIRIITKTICNDKHYIKDKLFNKYNKYMIESASTLELIINEFNE